MKVYAVRNKVTGNLIYTSSNNATGLYSTVGAAKIVKTQEDVRHYRSLNWPTNRSVYTKRDLPEDFVSPFEVVMADITELAPVE